MAQPNFIYDGNMTVATQDGPGWFVRPFKDNGDTQSWEYHAWFTQLASAYIPLRNAIVFTAGVIPYIEQMSTLATSQGTGYLVHEDEPTEVGTTGLLKFKRVYAGLPVTRYEPCDVAYAFQASATVGGNAEVQEWPYPLAGYRLYEYFVSTFPAVLVAPAVNVLFNVFYQKGGYPQANTPGDAYIAKDSVIKIYKGAIIERMTLYYIAPDFTLV